MEQSTEVSSVDNDDWQTRFVEWLPIIRRRANSTFRLCTPQLREELVAEVVADVYCAHRRLVELGRQHDAHLTVLVGFAIKRVGSGLQTGTPRNLCDLTSRYSQLHSGLRVKSLQCRDADGEWNEIVSEQAIVTGGHCSAATRHAHWLATLSIRNRGIALMLAVGEQTSHVARTFGLTAGRVAQLRRELFEAWQRFHGLDVDGRELKPITA